MSTSTRSYFKYCPVIAEVDLLSCKWTKLSVKSLIKMELRVGNKFKLVKKLGSGAFGELYAGINIKTGEEVAVKLELIYMEKP
jgi:serine/threonine protein kinase